TSHHLRCDSSTFAPFFLSSDIFLIMQCRPPITTLFPYTTLFRSHLHKCCRLTESFTNCFLLFKKILQCICRGIIFYIPCMKLLRSEEHTSELQSRFDLVCRLLLEKKTIMNSLYLIISNFDMMSYI